MKRMRFSWRAVFCVLLVAVLACGFAACSGEEEPEETARPKPTAEATVEPTTAPITEPTAEPTATPEPTPAVAKRTMMVYMVGSTLEYDSRRDEGKKVVGCGSATLEQMMSATASDDVNIVIQTGGTEQWRNDNIQGGVVQRFEIKNKQLVELDNLGKLNMGEKSTLSEFIKYVKKNYEAEEYILVLWDHGGGVPNGVGYDSLFNNDYLTDIELKKALETAGVHFDLVVFNACLMCSLEVYKSIEDYADYAIAAESVSWGSSTGDDTGFNYRDFLNELNVTDKAITDCCDALINGYMDYLKRIQESGTMSLVRLNRIERVYEAYAQYISACYDDLCNGKYYDIIAAREASGEFDGYDFVDLQTFATKYENKYSTDLINELSGAILDTKSIGYNNGRGITAYFPYLLTTKYSAGRQSLVDLHYDTSIVKFYDLLASKQLYVRNQLSYAGDWYVDQSNATDLKKTGTVSTVFDETKTGEKRAVDIEEFSTGKFGVRLPDNWWSTYLDTTTFRRALRFYNPDKQVYYYLGSDSIVTHNEGYTALLMKRPTQWLSLNKCFVTIIYNGYNTTYNVGVYRAYANVDGNPSLIEILVDKDQNITINGYYNTPDYTLKSDSKFAKFTGTEKVKPVVQWMKADGTNTYAFYAEINASELAVNYISIEKSEQYDYSMAFFWKSKNGNTYSTNWADCYIE